MTLMTLLAPTFLQMLGALSAWLAKAEKDMLQAEAEALLAARLAPDMFPLATQIRFACVQAQEALYHLTGQAFPPSADQLREEALQADEQPGTIADAQARIAETLAIVNSMAENTPDVDPAQPLAHTLPVGIIMDFTAGQYARDWALGQFYFHLMAAYAILRHRGVALGKLDYVAHLLPYVRPGTMPQN